MLRYRRLLRIGIRPTLIALQAKRRHDAKQKLLEFAELLSLVDKPSVVVEIGTLRGGTLWAWTRVAAPDALIVSIDLPGGSFGGGYLEADMDRLRAYARANQQVELLRADSHSPQTLNRLESLLAGREIDVLFIDGDHSYEGVGTDYNLYSPLVKQSGMVVFHDVLPHPSWPDCQVHRFWNEIKNSSRHAELVDRSDLWGGIGVLFHAQGSP